MTDLTHSLYRNGVFFFVMFFILALGAFWTSYYGVLQREMPYYIHLHGISMTLWCLMLITQATLIRMKRHKIHRMMGKLSFVLVPLIVISGLHLTHYTVKQSSPGSASYYYQIALMVNALIIFTLFYGLAIWNRRKPAIHARYMLCTVFPLVTPVTDRIIYKYIDSLVPLVPTIQGMPVVPTIGYAIADLIVLCLLIWDWKAHRRLNVFPFVLATLLLYHVSVLTFWKYPFWQKFGDWIMGLPLS